MYIRVFCYWEAAFEGQNISSRTVHYIANESPNPNKILRSRTWYATIIDKIFEARLEGVVINVIINKRMLSGD